MRNVGLHSRFSQELTWTGLRDLLIKHHQDFLAKNGGMRPKKWDSLHSAISETMLKPHLDDWKVVEACLA
jgi:hypothetical protein